MKILVTGGAGYIGSHACKLLARRGHQPITYDNLSRGHREAVKFGPMEVGDIGDGEAVRAALRKHRPDAVMHFAAFAYVAESVTHPAMYHRNNVAGSLALLDAIADYGPIPVVFSSSCATYGLAERLPIDESHPQRPINPYGLSKLAVEQMLAELGTKRGIPWMALRYFNAAGCDPDGEIGEMHDPETHLIPLALKAALVGAPVQVCGTDYDTPDGTCIRDFVHVSDIAEAHVQALDHLLKGAASEALNLANARGYSVREVIDAAKLVCGRDIPVAVAPRRPGDPPVLTGSFARAQAVLGWAPQRSALETQIEDAWRWFSARGG